MRDSDWARIEADWEEEEEERPGSKPAAGGIDLQQVEAMAKGTPPEKLQEVLGGNQASSGPAMMFATVDYPGCCDDKEHTDLLANKWTSLLSTSGMEQQIYVIQNDIILFTTQAGRFATEIKDLCFKWRRRFLLQQPEVVAVEWNQIRTPGPAETEEWKAREAKRKKEQKSKKEETAPKTAARDTSKKRKRKRKKPLGQSGGGPPKDEV